MDLATYLNAVTGFFVIIDPIGAALVFHSLVPGDEKQHRKVMAFKAITISALLLIIFGNYGQPLLNQLGININSLRIAGGLLLFYTAFNMITEDIEYASPTEKKDISVFPMSIPLLAGPGSLTLSILLFSNSNGSAEDLSVLAAIITICLLTLILMLISKYLKKVIGKTGDEILRRFLGVILAALAIQFIYDGIINMVA
ncbi:MAG TPA: MarC family protein [Balneolaceae bacterium]